MRCCDFLISFCYFLLFAFPRFFFECTPTCWAVRRHMDTSKRGWEGDNRSGVQVWEPLVSHMGYSLCYSGHEGIVGVVRSSSQPLLEAMRRVARLPPSLYRARLPDWAGCQRPSMVTFPRDVTIEGPTKGWTQIASTSDTRFPNPFVCPNPKRQNNSITIKFRWSLECLLISRWCLYTRGCV